jgi:hypothetical protein
VVVVVELIIAIFVVTGWYVYKYVQKLKKNEQAAAVVEAESKEKIPSSEPLAEFKALRQDEGELKNKTTSSSTCDFCDGEDIYIAGTKEKMPCPKCKRGMKIS